MLKSCCLGTSLSPAPADIFRQEGRIFSGDHHGLVTWFNASHVSNSVGLGSTWSNRHSKLGRKEVRSVQREYCQPLQITHRFWLRICYSGIVIRKGPLAILRDPTSNRWNRFYVVLRRPYLYLYESPVATNEVSVINLSTVRVEQNAEIERMLEVRSAGHAALAFCDAEIASVHSANSLSRYSLIKTGQCWGRATREVLADVLRCFSYFLSTQSQHDMLDWMKAIDPSLA